VTFHNTRLPDDVERGAQGGPRFRTTVLQLTSGFERRNIDWEEVRGEWDIGYGIQSKANFKDVQDFFYARQGRAHSFRFKDWADFELARQLIGATDTSTADFQLFKRYSSGGIDFDRNLYMPVVSSWEAWIGGLTQVVVYNTPPSGFEVSFNTITGIVTIGATHVATNGFDLEVQGEFDVAARFDTDSFDISMAIFDAGSIPQLPIREVRITGE